MRDVREGGTDGTRKEEEKGADMKGGAEGGDANKAPTDRN